MNDDSILIKVNGESRRLSVGVTLDDLVRELGFEKRRVAVERNLDVVRRADFPNTLLVAGDQIEIVTFVGGG